MEHCKKLYIYYVDYERQECTLSPLLFNLYDDAMMKEATSDIGIKVGGYMVKLHD